MLPPVPGRADRRERPPLELRISKVSPPDVKNAGSRKKSGIYTDVELAESVHKESTRRVRRRERWRLSETARKVAREEGHRCPDCGSQGAWDPGAAAVVCGRCGVVLGKSGIPSGARCGQTAAPGALRLRAYAELPTGERRA